MIRKKNQHPPSDSKSSSTPTYTPTQSTGSYNSGYQNGKLDQYYADKPSSGVSSGYYYDQYSSSAVCSV